MKYAGLVGERNAKKLRRVYETECWEVACVTELSIEENGMVWLCEEISKVVQFHCKVSITWPLTNSEEQGPCSPTFEKSVKIDLSLAVLLTAPEGGCAQHGLLYESRTRDVILLYRKGFNFGTAGLETVKKNRSAVKFEVAKSKFLARREYFSIIIDDNITY